MSQINFTPPEFYILDIANDYICNSCYRIYPCQFIENNKSHICCCNKVYPTKQISKIVKYYSILYCDYCYSKKEYYEIIDLSEENYPIPIKDTEYDESIHYRKKIDACLDCFNKFNLVKEIDAEELKKREDTIHWTITYTKTIDDINFYVIYEHNNVPGRQHCIYNLVAIKNGNIILNYELDSYNPYFGIDIIDVTIEQPNNIVKVVYREKHHVCEVKLKFGSDNEITNKYTIDGIYYVEPIGQVIEFINNGKIMKNNRYYDPNN